MLDDRHELLVRSVAVVLRPEADSPVLNGVYRRQFPGEKPHVVFRYQVVRVWELPVEELLEGGIATLPLAPISNVTAEHLPGVIARMKERLDAWGKAAQAQELWTATRILLGLRYSSRAFIDNLLRGVRNMNESVTYQAIVAEGRLEGAVAEAKKFLLLWGEDRFGPPTARQRTALEKITDLQQLEALGARVRQVTSWHELLDMPQPRRGARRKPPG